MSLGFALSVPLRDDNSIAIRLQASGSVSA